MTKQEMLDMLGVAPQQTEGDTGADFSAESKPAAPPSRTALVLDEWSRRRGEELVDTPGALRAVMNEWSPKTPDGWESMNSEEKTPYHEERKRRIEVVHDAAADCHAAAFETCPELVETCTDETRHRYMEELLDSEAYHALHSETAGDLMASEMAAAHFAKGWVALMTAEPPEDETDFQQRLRAMNAANDATQAAGEEVDDLRDMQHAIGSGEGTGGSVADLRERFARIKDNPTLRAIMARAGRLRRFAQAAQRQKTTHGRDDVVGIEFGADLGRIVPSELAQLADDDLEWLALRRFTERAMLQREYRGVEPVAQGPIVVVVDESGSMEGDKIEAAKALALALAWIAKHQKRWICLVAFADDNTGRFLAMPPEKWDDNALLYWIESFMDGGTNADVPLVTVPKRWIELGCPKGKTDIITITDGQLDVSDGLAGAYNAWKEANQVKQYTLYLDLGGSEPGDMEKVSDVSWQVDDLDLGQDAIQQLMSI